MLGIDEAGRGSLVGPLVVGGFLTSRDRIKELLDIGTKDSKSLTASAREEVFAGLGSIGTKTTLVVPPKTIDESVRQGRLNVLEAEAFARVIRKLAPDVAYVDACDPNERRFGRHVARFCGGSTKVIARHYADRDFLVVGAASIVAKVTRDRAIARLRAKVGDGLGSGYPSDEKTIRFVRAHLEGKEEIPEWVRSSWATMQRVKPLRPGRTLDAFEP